MPRDDLYLAELVDAAREIERYLDGVTRDRWDTDSMLRSAVLHQLTVIGEIARALSEEMRGRHPSIPWKQIRSFRNIAVHKYFAIDWVLVWKIANDAVPDLERQAMVVLEKEFPDLARRCAEDS